MSIKLMSEVWDLELSHSQQSVMLALTDHAHDDGTSVYPSVDYLAWKTGYDSRSIQRILRELEIDGLIVPVGFVAGGRGNTTEYTIDLSAGKPKAPFDPSRNRLTPKRRQRFLRELIDTNDSRCSYCGEAGDEVNGPDGTAWHIDRIEPGIRGPGYVAGNVALSCGPCNRKKKDAKGTPFTSAKRVQNETQKGANSAKKGANSTQKGANSARAYIEEPSIEPSVEPSVEPLESGEPPTQIHSKVIEDCLDYLNQLPGYPKERKRNGEQLEKKWREYPSLDLREEVRKFCDYYVDGFGRNGRPRGRLATWLNNADRWAREEDRRSDQVRSRTKHRRTQVVVHQDVPEECYDGGF